MIAYMNLKGCYAAVTSPRPIATKDNKEEVALWDERDHCAHAILLLALEDQVAYLVCHLTRAKDIWTRLCESYESRGSGSKVGMMMQFANARMKPQEKVIEYVNRLQRLYVNLNQAGGNVTEENFVAKLVAGLSSDYHVFMTTWSNNCSLRQTVAELLPRLLAEEALISGLQPRRNQDAVALAGEASHTGTQSRGQRQGSQPARNQSNESNNSRGQGNKSN